VINLEETVVPMVQRIKALQYHLCTVESCTGGLVSNLVTDVSGASAIFWGGAIVYDDSAKKDLGVPATVLKKYGAVSPEVAKALAEMGLYKMKKNPWRVKSYALAPAQGLICVSTTGIAGPSGGTQEKPVGLCYLGLAIHKKKGSSPKTIVDRFQASGRDRIQIKTEFAQRAFQLIQENISGKHLAKKDL
jgi:PncC family amidohydrolase